MVVVSLTQKVDEPQQRSKPLTGYSSYFGVGNRPSGDWELVLGRGCPRRLRYDTQPGGAGVSSDHTL